MRMLVGAALGGFLLGAVVIGSTATWAAESTAVEPVGPRLSPRLRDLLAQEMAAILVASGVIQEALVRGDADSVSAQARNIRDSFILKRQLTQEDRKALRAAVGAAFVQRDQAFHRLAGDLAEAADAGDRTEQHRLYGAMIEACASCHAQYAADKFPGFAVQGLPTTEGDAQ